MAVWNSTLDIIIISGSPREGPVGGAVTQAKCAVGWQWRQDQAQRSGVLCPPAGQGMACTSCISTVWHHVPMEPGVPPCIWRLLAMWIYTESGHKLNCTRVCLFLIFLSIWIFCFLCLIWKFFSLTWLKKSYYVIAYNTFFFFPSPIFFALVLCHVWLEECKCAKSGSTAYQVYQCLPQTEQAS